MPTKNATIRRQPPAGLRVAASTGRRHPSGRAPGARYADATEGRHGRGPAPRRRPVTPPRPPARRLVGLLVTFVIAFVAIVGRLVVLQVKDAGSLGALAVDQRLRRLTLPAPRGAILDRSGQPLAMSVPTKAVYADPALVRDPALEGRIVARALGLDPVKVAAALRARGRFLYVARGVDLRTAGALEARHLAGIGFLDESRRSYPGGALAPQVLGFVNVDGAGLAGLELQYQDALAGRPGRQLVEEDPTGTLIPQGDNSDRPAVGGTSIVLTIDREIQYRAQASLAAAVKANHAKGGTVIVMDPRTGDILAMATNPSFDPNDFQRADPATYRNRAVTDVYEPGSVNKVITAAAALQTGVMDDRRRLSVPDRYRLYTKTFTDAEPHRTERMTLGDILAYSSNVGAITVASMLGPDRLYWWLRRFGLDRPTGLPFPGQSDGLLPPVDQWSGTSMGTIPIGQGIAVTPLQMTEVYATIANGGVWVRPRLVAATIAAGGRRAAVPPAPTRRVVSVRTAADISRMLGYAVDVGTGTEAQIPGYWVAGKTGTARKVLANGTGYSDKYIASFIGFTPASRPALVVAAILDEPATVFGGIASAPLFREVARSALARLRVPPAPKLPVPPHAVPTG